jgi:pimeloyl-[acyl-carrier protein] methyl ester esterase
MDDFHAVAPRDARVDLVPLPNELSGYSELARHFEATLPLNADSILIAESFSGPLAIMLAERVGVAALILCNTFAKGPYPGAFAILPFGLVARVPPPAFLVRGFILGWSASDSMVNQVQSVVDKVPAQVFVERTRNALRVDVRRELARYRSPILYLRGSKDRLIWRWNADTIVRSATVPVSVVDIAAPHLLLKTSPTEAWRAIEAFLSSHSS